MKHFLRLCCLFVLLFPGLRMNGQCANDNVLAAGNLTPVTVNVAVSQSMTCGTYMLAFVQAGASYTISTCSSSSFDTQITVYNDATGAFIVYNDDFCGLQSTVNFTPNFCGFVRVLLDQFFCSTTSTLVGTVDMTQTSAGSGLPQLTAAPNVATCSGGVIQVGTTNNGFGGTPPYNYSWLPVTNLATPTQAASSATVTATTNYTLTLTDANGCLARDTVVASVLPNPVVSLGPDTQACGNAFTLNAGNPGNSYLWSTGAGTQTLTVTQAGTYSVSVLTPLGCIGSDNITVGFVANPVVSLADTISCSNAVLLNAGAGYQSYNWSNGDTTAIAAITTSGNYTVIVIDSNNCSGTDSVQVTMSPAPSVSLGPNVTQCGDTVVLNAGNPGAQYIWSNQTSSQTAALTAVGSYPVSVVVISPQGCYGYDTVQVTINNQPDANLGPDTSICTSTITLDAGNPGSSYVWSGGSNPSAQINTLANGTFTLTVTDPNGSCSDSDTITVTTNVPPVVSAGQNVTICPGQPTTLTATGANTYLWSDGNVGATNIVSPTTTTTYYVTGTNASGCQDADVVTVIVLPTPSASFTHTVSGASANFTNNSVGAVTYSWNFGDSSPLDNSASPGHTYTSNGTFVVTLTVTGACGTATFTQTVVITQVGLQDLDLANTLSVYPNPNEGTFTIAFAFTSVKDAQIEVVDVQGRVIYTDQQQGISNYRSEVLLTAAESGVYVLRILTNDGIATQKIVVRR